MMSALAARSPSVQGAVRRPFSPRMPRRSGVQVPERAVQPRRPVARSAAAMFSKDTSPAEAVTASRPLVWVESWAVMTGL
ncbi:hypothetical protein SALBM311S_07086 [Streptomyces alboniger]